MGIKKAMATAIFLEKRKEDTLEFLAENISSSFQLLANIDANLALSVLEQINDQFDEEKAETLTLHLREQIEDIADKMVISHDDLD